MTTNELNETTKNIIHVFVKDAETGESNKVTTIDGVTLTIRRRFAKTHCEVSVPRFDSVSPERLRLFAAQVEYAAQLLAFTQRVISERAA